MPRYVILLHEMPVIAARGTHYDVMLEWGSALRTWAIDEPPSAGCDWPALALPDHRLAYLDYQGEVSGDRGRVTRWDAGEYVLLAQSPILCEVELRGWRFRGRCKLVASDTNHWRAYFTHSQAVEES